ncbi:MAG: HNH endonuclease [Thermoleophilia bacterium]
MTITDKTRKILWGRSGNKCAICKHDLIIDATKNDEDAVVGEECHVVSAKQNGPRHDSSYPTENLHSYDNLMLLCRVHHKMIDDQVETYTVDILRQMKLNHESWVSEKLTDKEEIKPVKVKRIKDNIPDFLSRLYSGQEIIHLLSNAYAFWSAHDDPKTQEEVELIGNFLQVTDYVDLLDEISPKERLSIEYDLTQELQTLEAAGFYVFGGLEMQRLEGGAQKAGSSWPVAHLVILRKSNESIIKVNIGSGSKMESINDTESY